MSDKLLESLTINLVVAAITGTCGYAVAIYQTKKTTRRKFRSEMGFMLAKIGDSQDQELTEYNRNTSDTLLSACCGIREDIPEGRRAAFDTACADYRRFTDKEWDRAADTMFHRMFPRASDHALEPLDRTPRRERMKNLIQTLIDCAK
jgi:hypothetical protein